MKIFRHLFFQGAMALLGMGLLASSGRAQNAALFAVLAYPTNNQAFTAPTNLYVHAQFTDTNPVQTVQYFSGTNLIGVATTTATVIETNLAQGNPLPITWSNVTAGVYSLSAVVIDRAGNLATSAPVSITVTNPVLHPAVYIYSPANNATFVGPTNLSVYARAVETGGTVAQVQIFANGTSLGVVSNYTVFTNISMEPLYTLAWSNVSVGAYALTAVATDSSGNSATSSVVTIAVVSNLPPVIVRPSVGIYFPTNYSTFPAPTNVNIYARAVESPGLVATVQFFANSLNLGVVSNSSQVTVSNLSSVPLFPLTWSNAPAGSYGLKVIATDTNGYTATSSVVNITISTNQPPPNIPFTVSFWYPTNGQSFLASANVGVHALVTDSNVVQTMQYFANGTSLGMVTNPSTVLLTNTAQGSPFFLDWSNVLAGSYALTAVAMDNAGHTATSSVVNITVTNVPPPNVPFAVGFWYPTNGQTFVAPANVGVHARVTDSNLVQTVQYFANGNSVGSVTNTSLVLLTNSTQGNAFFLDWSNVPAGTYALIAVVTDSAGNNATSAPVTIFVLVTPPPSVNIYATDPVAIVGTNTPNIYYPTTTASNYISGGNTATFVVHRNTSTNTDLMVYYSIGGTAINGEDYETLPGSVVIPAGKSYALITVYPLEGDASYPYYDSAVLSVIAPPALTNSPPTYAIGSPATAAAIILNDNYLPIPQPLIRSMVDYTLHISLPATNGMNACLQISTNLVNWLPVCTNTVVKGSAQFVDPNGMTNPGLYYRIVPAATPASY